MKNDFYVYVYFHPASGLPCYVGKGRGRRWLTQKHRTNPHLLNIIGKYGALPCIKTREHLTEAEAFETEMALIRAIGRGADGPLVNFTDGGEGAAGWIAPAETRAKLSLSSSRPDRLAALAERNSLPEHIERLRRLAQCPIRLAKASEIARSPESRARLAAHNRSPEKRALIAARNKANPKLLAAIRRHAFSPEWRARRSALSREPEHQRKLLEHNRSVEHRAQVADRNRTEAMRASASARASKRNSSPEFQEKAAAGLRRYHERLRAEKQATGNKVAVPGDRD